MTITKNTSVILPYSFREYDNHRIVMRIHDAQSQLVAYVAIHRGGLKNPAFGATRLWNYSHEEDAIREVLKLSRIMSYKSALAGLPYGGAKAVIIKPNGEFSRSLLLTSYARSVNYLSGHFVTGADVGLAREDVIHMAKASPSMVGKYIDPVYWTIQGVMFALHVVCKELFGSDSLVKRSFAIQGLGKTGLGLLRAIYKEAKLIYVADINADTVKKVVHEYPHVKPVLVKQIHAQSVDIFSPCALSDAITQKNISELRCKAVIGMANSQLESREVGKMLHTKSILYAPDYVVNAGGLIAVTYEYKHPKIISQQLEAKVHAIAGTLKKIISESKQKKISVSEASDQLADKIIEKVV